MTAPGLSVEGKGSALRIAIAGASTHAQAVSDDVFDFHALKQTQGKTRMGEDPGTVIFSPANTYNVSLETNKNKQNKSKVVVFIIFISNKAVWSQLKIYLLQ